MAERIDKERSTSPQIPSPGLGEKEAFKDNRKIKELADSNSGSHLA